MDNQIDSIEQPNEDLNYEFLQEFHTNCESYSLSLSLSLHRPHISDKFIKMKCLHEFI